MMKRYPLFLFTLLMLLALVPAANAWEMTYDDGIGGTSTVEIDPSSCFNIDPDKEPVREGYIFTGWVLDYQRGPFSVTYKDTGDPEFKYPLFDYSGAPTDPNVYYAGDPVTVADALTTTDYLALDSQNRYWPGDWLFSGWDKEDFTISEDTEIHGSWGFTPCRNDDECYRCGSLDCEGCCPKETYKVNYREVGTDKVLAPQKVVPDMPLFKIVTESAIDIDGYTINGADTQDLEIRLSKIKIGSEVIDLYKNEITFYYDYVPAPSRISYVVRYVDELSGPLIPDAVREGVIPGEPITEYAEEIWGYTPIRTDITFVPGNGDIIVFMYYYSGSNSGPLTTGLTIRCVNEETGEELPGGEVLEGLDVWSEVTVAAPVVEGFYVANGAEQTRTITADASENEVIFRYAPETLVSYEVRFEGDDTEDPIAESLIRKEILSGSTVTETAPEIDNYEFDGKDEEKEQKLFLTNDAEANVLTFKYKRLLTDAEIRYEDADGEMLALPKELKDLPVGEELEEEAEIIPGCEADDQTLSMTLRKDPEENILIFTYSGCSGSIDADLLTADTVK